MVWLFPAAAAAGAATGELLRRRRLKQYRLAVIGLPQTGKSTLSSVLATNQLPVSPPGRTMTPRRLAGEYTFKDEGWVRWRAISDAGGDEDHFGSWRRLIEGAGTTESPDCVLYVFRADRVLAEAPRDSRDKTVERLRRDPEMLCASLAQAKRKAPFVFVGTHTDMVPRDRWEGEKFDELIARAPVIQEAVLALGGWGGNRLVAGSLAEITLARRLAHDVTSTVRELVQR